jgi:hypothetical protein
MALTQIKTGGLANNSVTDAKVADAITVTGAQTGITSVGTLTSLNVTGSVSGDWVAKVDNTHATDGYGLYVSAGDDANVKSFAVADKDDNDAFYVKGDGNATFAGSALITNGLRSTTGTERYLIFREGNELNTYTSSGVGDSNRATLHINHLGAGSTVDLSDSELVVVKGTGSTFAGNLTVNGTGSDIITGDYLYLDAADNSAAKNIVFRQLNDTWMGQIEFHPTQTSQIVTRVNQPLAFGVNNSQKMTIETDGAIKSTSGMYFTGTALDGVNTGIASSGDGGDLRFYISGNQNYTLSGHTLTIDSQGNGSPAQLTCKNTGSSGWTGAAINLLYEGSGGNRGCGVYMHSAATDKEWYAGTMYSVDTDRYSICYESTASFTEATAAAAHEVFYIGTSGQTWANGGYYATYNGSAVHALVGHTNELNICNSWTSGQNQIHFNYRMGNTYGDFTFFNGSSSGYPDLNAASFDTTSDYRMKKSVTNFTANVCDKIKLLRPVTYNWKANTKMTEAQQIGFLAHELQEQLPLAVKGEKDAMSEKDNTKIEPQTIKGEALSSYMMKALQEIITRLEVLENA